MQNDPVISYLPKYVGALPLDGLSALRFPSFPQKMRENEETNVLLWQSDFSLVLICKLICRSVEYTIKNEDSGRSSPLEMQI